MKYGLDDKPGIGALLLYGLQWWVVLLPSVVIMGAVVARLHHPGVVAQTFFMQKLFALVGVATIIQVLAGHRLPLVMGPASTLLVGVIASVGVSANAVHTAIFIGGLLLALVAWSGFLTRLRFFFTPRIVAVILALIAVTLAPTILQLSFAGGEKPLFHLVFTLGMVFSLLACNVALPGVWKALTVILGVLAGSLVYFGVQGFPAMPDLAGDAAPGIFITKFSFHAGAVLSFFFCFLALTINELGSIEAVGGLLRVADMEARIRKGVGLQGASNMAAGALGVVGTVDFSMSVGLISATGCASRYTLIPAGAAMAACALFPKAVFLLSCIPGPVMGALLLYLMASQLASGLGMLEGENGITDFASGITVGLPLMVGLLISFAPQAVIEALPGTIRSLAGNGFVMGTIAVIVLEHGLFRKKR